MPLMTTRIALQQLAQLGPFRWQKIAAGRAVRVALGVIAPLALGWASGHVEYGAYAALGALPAGFVSFQGETLSRVAAVVLASIGMAFSTFVGATTAAAVPWLLVPIVAIWGYVTGLAISLDQHWSVAVLQWSVALLIAIGLPLAPAEALLRAALVFTGGLFQAVLVAAAWTLRPGLRERTALADSYRALATYATDLAAGKFRAPPPAAFPAATSLTDANPLLPAAVRLTLIDLLEEAESIRASLAALAATADEVELRTLLNDAAVVLTLIADALISARAGRLPLIRRLRETLVHRTIAPEAPWRWAGEALLGQLRAVERTAANLEGLRSQQLTDSAPDMRAPTAAQNDASWALTTLQANLTTTSEAGRHALRLAVAAALAEAIVQAAGLYQGRWVALTIFIVLKPDYASTLYRGVQRALGTALGAGLGAFVEFVHPGPESEIVAAAVWIAAAYALFDVNYLLFSLYLTAFIVGLLSLLGSSPLGTAEARFLDTFIGAVLGLLAYLAWPTWEGAAAQEKFALLLEAHLGYATGLLRAFAYPGSVEAPRLRQLQAAARRARSNAEAATARLFQEPPQAPMTPTIAQALIAAVSGLAHAELALHTLALHTELSSRQTDLPRSAVAAIQALATALDTAMQHLALALRSGARPQPIPALRGIHAQLRNEVPGAVFIGLTDRLVDAIDTVDAILRRGFPANARSEAAVQ